MLRNLGHSGFVPNRNTGNAIFETLDDVYRGLDRKYLVAGIYRLIYF